MEFWRFIGPKTYIGEPLQAHHDSYLVVLSILIACLAAYAALAVVDRISAAGKTKGRFWWLLTGAIAMGSGIWAMHFTAMLAHTLPVGVNYDLWITAVSVLPAIIGSGIALATMSRSVLGWKTLLLAGLLMAVAIGTMHYSGMEAMGMREAVLYYDLPLFILSIVVAFLLSTLALSIKFLLSRSQSVFKQYQKHLSAGIMGFAVSGMHYTAMAATRIYSLPGGDTLADNMHDYTAPIFIGLAIFPTVCLIIGLTFIGTIVDKRLDDAQTSLRESEAWADKIIDTAADGIISIDDMGTILSFNRASENIFGYSSQDVMGKNVKILMTDDDRENHDGYLTRYRDTCHSRITGTYREVTARHKNGSVFPLELGVTEISRKQRRVFIGTMRDITHRKEAENSLKAHARQQAAMAELGQYAVLEQDIDEWFYIATEIVAEVLEAEYCKVLELMPDGENLLLRAGVGWRPGLVGSATVKVRASDSQAGYTMECHEPVVVENLATDTRFNGPELLRSHDVMSGMSVLITTNEGVFGIFGVHSKTPRTFNADDVNFIKSVAAILSQVIERKRIESQSKQIQSQLSQAQKLESIGQLSAGVAHEINTPTQFVGDNIRFLEGAFEDLLNVQQAYAGLLEAARKESVAADDVARVDTALVEADNDYLIEEIPHAIGQSIDGVQRIAKIVSAMKAFSHMGSETKELADLNAAIGNTVTVASNEWKYVAEMELDLDEDLPMVPCFPAEFNQVVLNLVVNAAHAIADVVDSSAEEKGKITVSSRQVDEEIEVRIGDTGGGIPEDARARVFDPFFTTKEVGKGTGQGLSLAHSTIVDKHGGSLDFETETGQGTTFVIRIPLEDSDMVEIETAAVAAG